MDNSSSVNEYIDLWMKMRLANDATYLALSEALSKCGCTREQFEVLFACERNSSPVTPAKLSRWTFRKSNSVAGLLNRMEKLGLVKRERSTYGIRRTLVLRTKKGQEVFQEAYATFAAVISKITSQCPDDELPRFKLCLKNIGNAALGELRIYELQSKPIGRKLRRP